MGSCWWASSSSWWPMEEALNAESGQSCSWSIVASFLRQHVLELHGFDLTQPTRMVTEFSEARMRVIDTTALQCQIHQPLLALRRRGLFTTSDERTSQHGQRRNKYRHQSPNRGGLCVSDRC